MYFGGCVIVGLVFIGRRGFFIVAIVVSKHEELKAESDPLNDLILKCSEYRVY
jgi:hypothetical protein